MVNKRDRDERKKYGEHHQIREMSNGGAGATSSSSLPITEEDCGYNDDDPLLLDGSESGWVEARTHCDHLHLLSSDLTHIPTPDTACYGCQHPEENWLCLTCKDVLCSRFVNKHMLHHFHQSNHALALSYSDLSVWCFRCNAYLDVRAILPLRPVHETVYILKFGEAPPFPPVVDLQPAGQDGASASGTRTTQP